MEGKIVLHILLLIVFFLAILACRMYYIKRNKHRIIVARVYPLWINPAPQQSFENRIQQTSSSMQGENTTNNRTNREQSANSGIDLEDQISLESHSITMENDARTAEIKSPPPPYSAGLPSYEEAIRWSQANNKPEHPPDAT